MKKTYYQGRHKSATPFAGSDKSEPVADADSKDKPAEKKK